MKMHYSAWSAIGAALLVAACGGGMDSGPAGTQNNNPGRGELMQNPVPQAVALTADEYYGRLFASDTGKGLLTLSTGSTTAALPCGVAVNYMKYGTVGGKGEATNASGAIMVPYGTGSQCTGPRPIVLFAHGTAVEKSFNMAAFTESSNPAYNQAQLVASLFAANGYIVVAPNYAGYDSSSLGYHPFLVAQQQSKDMMDALAAAKTALPTLTHPGSASDKLFVTGYSQGGHVALATFKAMQEAGMTVTAVAPMSGPYAASKFGDDVVGGAVSAGSTSLMPMLLNGYQKSYGTLYSVPTDIYESAYAANIEAAFPGNYSYTALSTNKIVPDTALFSSTVPAAYTSISPYQITVTSAEDALKNALWAAGFGTSNLINNTTRFNYLADVASSPDLGTAPSANPQNSLRIALAANDLRTFTTPTRPVLFCGGRRDPTVYFNNTELMYNAITTPVKAVYDVDAATAYSDARQEAVRQQFLTAITGIQNTAYTTAINAGKSATEAQTAAATALFSNYHSTVLPYCAGVAKSFFDAYN